MKAKFIKWAHITIAIIQSILPDFVTMFKKIKEIVKKNSK